MHIKLSSLMIALAVTGSAHAGTPRANEAATARHLATLTAGPNPQLSALTLFFSRMPKGGDLHHHYSGAIYVEHYLQWIDQQNWCIDKLSYRITTDKAVVDEQRAQPIDKRSCLGGADVFADDATYRELLQRWSSKDFDNHGAIQAPPDRQFFQTFGYFAAVSNVNYNLGLQQLKRRAVAENVSYIETMFKMTPPFKSATLDTVFAQPAADDAALTAQLRAAVAALDQDPQFGQGVDDYVSKVESAAAGIDDANFTMRYQTYSVRLMKPAQVFSSLLGGFRAAAKSPLIVGINMVGQESNYVSMRDYSLHMKMFRFLKAAYPDVKLALHAGELALGDVPPEELSFHIDEALAIAGADRIGHGIDLAHETNALGIMKFMRERSIPVEINLTSNSFISGIKGENHPVTLYRKYGVPMVISTDDAGVTRHTLTQEYVLFASRYKPDYAEIKKLSYNSLKYAFLEPAERERLVRQLDQRYAKFEAEIAGMKAAKR